MKPSLHLGTVRGIDIGVNWSVGIVLAILAFNLGSVIFPDSAPDAPVLAYSIVAVATAVLFLAGLLAHELGHSLVAIRSGVRVESITLWVFGGIAALGERPSRPSVALRIALAGPAVSVALAVASYAVAAALAALGAPELAVSAFVWLALTNGVLAAFNLLPAFPLDGGRVLAALLWKRRDDEVAATLEAARLGRGFGMALIGLGVFETVFVGVGGIWLMLIGWFLRRAAEAEATAMQFEVAFAPFDASTVMSPAPSTVSATMTVDAFVDHVLGTGNHASYPVVRDGRVSGLVTVDAVRDVAPENRSRVTVGELAQLDLGHGLVGPATPVADLVRHLDGARAHRVIVVDSDGRVMGIVAPDDITRLGTVLGSVRGGGGVDALQRGR